MDRGSWIEVRRSPPQRGEIRQPRASPWVSNPKMIPRLPGAKRHPSSLLPNPQSTIHNPQSTIHNPQSTIHNPQSSILNPQSSIHNHPQPPHFPAGRDPARSALIPREGELTPPPPASPQPAPGNRFREADSPSAPLPRHNYPCPRCAPQSHHPPAHKFQNTARRIPHRTDHPPR